MYVLLIILIICEVFGELNILRRIPMIPTIGTKGIFIFAIPYKALTNPDQSLEVVSIRLLTEIQASGGDPLKNIYLASGATEADFGVDVANNVSIITFRTDSNDYIYVPEHKVTSDAMLTGTPYMEKTVLVNLGHIPTAKDLTTVISNIVDTVNTTIGITPDMQVLGTSSEIRVDAVKHKQLTDTRAAKITTDKSYKTRYTELLALYNEQKAFITNIETVYAANGIGG